MVCVSPHFPADTPVLRHYSSAYSYYGAVAGAQLVVRMISTVYNYDYIQDLHLNIDGTVDVKVVTTGYVQATTFRSFYPRHYGFPLFTNVSGESRRTGGHASCGLQLSTTWVAVSDAGQAACAVPAAAARSADAACAFCGMLRCNQLHARGDLGHGYHSMVTL